MAVNYRAWTRKQKVCRVLLYTFMILLATVFILPLYYTAMTSFKPLDELMKFPPDFYVRRPTLQNFSDLLSALDASTVPFVRYLFNSVFTTVISVFLCVAISSMGAYGLVKHKVFCGRFWFGLIMIALMFPTTVIQIPNFVIINKLHLVNTYAVVIITKLCSPFYFFLIKTFIEQFPNEFLEAARLDGAGELYIFRKIVIPFMKPAIATLIVFAFMNCWNDGSTSVLYITDDSLKLIPYALSAIGGSGVARMGASAAVSFLMLIPPIVVFLSMQKNVIETMVYAGIK